MAGNQNHQHNLNGPESTTHNQTSSAGGFSLLNNCNKLFNFFGSKKERIIPRPTYIPPQPYVSTAMVSTGQEGYNIRYSPISGRSNRNRNSYPSAGSQPVTTYTPPQPYVSTTTVSTGQEAHNVRHSPIGGRSNENRYSSSDYHSASAQPAVTYIPPKPYVSSPTISSGEEASNRQQSLISGSNDIKSNSNTGQKTGAKRKHRNSTNTDMTVEKTHSTHCSDDESPDPERDRLKENDIFDTIRQQNDQAKNAKDISKRYILEIKKRPTAVNDITIDGELTMEFATRQSALEYARTANIANDCDWRVIEPIDQV